MHNDIAFFNKESNVILRAHLYGVAGFPVRLPITGGLLVINISDFFMRFFFEIKP